MRLLRNLVTAGAMLTASFQAAAAAEWWLHPGDTSAVLAANDWDLVSSSAMSWPDGRQLLITFWKFELGLIPGDETVILVRCYDYFDTDMQSTGGGCYSPRDDQ